MANETKKPKAEEAAQRVFVYNEAELEDPDASMGDKAVQNHYAQVYPELTTANLSISFEDRAEGRTKVVNFKKAAGTKG